MLSLLFLTLSLLFNFLEEYYSIQYMILISLFKFKFYFLDATFTLTCEDKVVFSFCLFPESSYLFWALSFILEAFFTYLVIHGSFILSKEYQRVKDALYVWDLGAPLLDGWTEIGLFHWGNQNVSTFKPFPCGCFSVEKNHFL